MLFGLHLLATGLYLGTTLGLALFIVPQARRASDAAASRALLARSLRFYDPLAIALLGVMVMTGAWSVTDYKQTLGTSYFADFGAHLVWKLGLAFLVVMAGTYIAFGLGHRLVREDEWGETVDERRLRSMTARLSGSAWLCVALTIATVVVAMRR
ncbi:hypothetical protein K2Z84_24255 [Candidatus Binatia bacterium]|nr:hypothetical protein [Candidatus Binatia bacterium]